MLGFTLGIVVQNNDPQKRGRVKVFIPHLSMNLYEDWDILDEEKTFEKLSDPKIKVVIDRIKNQLPWANCAAPIVGEIGNHYYNAFEQDSKTGDSVDKESDKPSKDIEENPPIDEFGNKYEHTSYSNSTKGLFSVPKVGSKVWVFFENGNLNRPVYFATTYSKDDWTKISNEDYPDTKENFSKNDQGESDDIYKNKMVVSQRGGIIEIVNTDDMESVQISHFNGGFKIWSNGGTTEFVEGEEKQFVRSNSQIHIGGNCSIHIDGNQDVRIIGNVNMLVDGTYTLESKGNMKFIAPRIDFNP